jgi:hypothetical protein
VQYHTAIVDAWNMINETCPNGITPVFGYMFRGFARSAWTQQLEDAHEPFVQAIRQIALSPFYILLCLIAIYTFAQILFFISEWILLRADYLRENPYVKVPLVEIAGKLFFIFCCNTRV